MNPYKVLGIKSNSSKQVVKKAFRTLSKKYHPDISTDISGEKFIEVLNAYEILKSHNWKWDNGKNIKLDFDKIYRDFVAKNPVYAYYFEERVLESQALWSSMRNRP